MSDEIDAADIRQQTILEAKINNIRFASRIDISGNGECLVCGNEVDAIVCAGKTIIGRWCSIECRERSDL